MTPVNSTDPAFDPPKNWFSCWWEPNRLFRAVDLHREHVENVPLFSVPRLQRVKEFLAAASFACIRSQDQPCQLRFIDDIFPDFELRFHNHIEPFELVEADRPGRRRGEEYKMAAQLRAEGKSAVTHVDPDLEEDQAIPAVEAAIKAKAGKKYSPAPNLLVYVNFSWATRKNPFALSHARAMGEKWESTFPSLWLFWKNNAIRCHPLPVTTIERRQSST
ncbi:MAG: hypothetical protein AB7G15_12855 [Alphaproteobacteria bacterium]